MTGCRIARVTDKATGKTMSVIGPAMRSSAPMAPDMVEVLQRTLADVRSGETRSVAIVSVSTDGKGLKTIWAFEDADGASMIAALEALKHDMLAART